MKNILILIIFLYILVLFQTSFLIHFNIRGIIPNFILFVIIFISLFEKPEKNLGFFSAIFGGFFLDIFSEKFFGFYILILAGLVIFIKLILKRYIQVPIIKRA